MKLHFLGAGLALCLLSPAVRADDWPQWLGPKRDGVWRETGILDKFPEKGPKVLWRTPIGGGYTGPAVTGGKVYVTDLVKGDGGSKERVLCLEEATGKIVWTHEYPVRYTIQYPAGPRCTPTVDGDRVYTLGAMGDLFCLDIKSGKVIWSKNFPKDYEAGVPTWGFAAHPLVDGDKLICLVGGQGSVAVAFDKKDGKELWKSLSLKDAQLGYSPPMIYEAGGKRQLIVWHPEAVNGLDPETGKVYWSEPFTSKANLTAPTPRKHGDNLFITSFYNGSMMLKLDASKPAASVVWKAKRSGERPDQTENLNAIIATPVFKGEHIYGVCSYGELRCLKVATGERVWMTLKATGNETKPTERWANAFLIENGDRYFLFNEKGDLIIARLTPEKYEEVDRAHILEPTGRAGRPVLWSHPAFANKCMFARNDKEIVRVSLAAGK